MKLSVRYLALLLGLAVLLALALFNQPLVMAWLVAPIARFLWLIVRTFLSIDQGIYWILLVFTVFILTLWMIPGRQEVYRRPSYGQTGEQEDRVAYWSALLEAADESVEGRLQLQSRLRGLQESVDALAEDSARAEIRLPAFRPGLRQMRLLKQGRAWLRRLQPQHRGRLSGELAQHVGPILDSMEKRLEIPYGK